jgi:hypothetical protein
MTTFVSCRIAQRTKDAPMAQLKTQPRLQWALRHLALMLGAFSVAAAFAAPIKQRTFATTDEAVKALIEAVKSGDRAALVGVVGPEAENALLSGDAVADRATADRFISRFEKKNAIVPSGENRATLTIDTDDWPFAYPLVKTAGGWRFDTKAGNEELLARRIGENELNVMNVMLAIVDAQREYALLDRDGDGLPEYATKFASTPGKKDGLYWKTGPGEPLSPLGNLVSRATGEGYTKSVGPRAYHGYYYRMLPGQGPEARGGAYNYTVKGKTIGGFAVIAYPAKYANSGVMSFMVNHDGVVYEKDLGPNSEGAARAITRFNPAGWKPSPVK